jgi:glycine/D-amino acid oxidase-like deaminating enzyme
LRPPPAGLPMSPSSDSNAVPRVVIVGAGFAGLAAARKLASAPADILVIAQNLIQFAMAVVAALIRTANPRKLVRPSASVLYSSAIREKRFLIWGDKLFAARRRHSAAKSR